MSPERSETPAPPVADKKTKTRKRFVQSRTGRWLIRILIILVLIYGWSLSLKTGAYMAWEEATYPEAYKDTSPAKTEGKRVIRAVLLMGGNFMADVGFVIIELQKGDVGGALRQAWDGFNPGSNSWERNKLLMPAGRDLAQPTIKKPVPDQ